MSWRAGNKLFWETWPAVKDNIPDPEVRAEFTRGFLTLLLDMDADPSDFRDRDPEVDRLMDIIDPEL